MIRYTYTYDVTAVPRSQGHSRVPGGLQNSVGNASRNKIFDIYGAKSYKYDENKIPNFDVSFSKPSEEIAFEFSTRTFSKDKNKIELNIDS